eukprot:TRINITY_DN36684_c0_g2_i1.p1 TRINITY_DN36684_c0_g2~~TRINITY_DN36684_c0_g2_i1.p1  ORF type:complete len:621 (-),score=141.19 TRINITY_DN36684_c0_g2_i1:35-1897(-)
MANGLSGRKVELRDDPSLIALQTSQRDAVLALAERVAQHGQDEEADSLYDDPLALVRYLRARKWDPEPAEELLRKTGRWRKELQFSEFMRGAHMDEVERESKKGNIYVRGFDRRGRPAIYLKPGGEGWNAERAGILHLVYCIERAVACLEKQAERGKLMLDADDPLARKFVLLADFAGVGWGNMLPLTAARDLVGIMQDHYPERLGAAFFVNYPWILSGVFSAASSFIDPVTVKKFHFISEEGEERSKVMSVYFDLSQLEPEFGGTAEELFQSHIFLDKNAGDAVFGLEFSKQLELSRYQQASPISFLHVYRNSRVLNLPAKERDLVRRLARVLSKSLPTEDDCNFFIQAGMMIRYLKSKDWDVDKAEAAIHSTIAWRQESRVDDLRNGKCSPPIARECASRRLYVRGYDKNRRPIVYVKFDEEDSGMHEDILKYIVYVAERSLAILQRQEEQEEELSNGDCVTLIVDFSEYASANRPSFRTLLAASRLLQDHYPEMLGKAYMRFFPDRFSYLRRVLWALMRPQTREKFVFVDSAEQWHDVVSREFDLNQLERSVGGSCAGSFESRTFLTRKVNGAVYGSEYNEQAAANVGMTKRVSFSERRPSKELEHTMSESSRCSCQ